MLYLKTQLRRDNYFLILLFETIKAGHVGSSCGICKWYSGDFLARSLKVTAVEVEAVRRVAGTPVVLLTVSLLAITEDKETPWTSVSVTLYVQ